MRKFGGFAAGAATAALCAAALATASPVLAQVKPGDMITAETAAKVKDLVSPGVLYKVERGMSMKIVPTQRIDWPPPYKDATEKYSPRSASVRIIAASSGLSRASRSR